MEEKNHSEEFFNNGLANEEEGQLAVDVYQTENDLVVQAMVAGTLPDDLEINIVNENISIRGKREKEEKAKEKDYYYQECFWGTYSRSIILPQEVDPSRSVASLKNGVLTVRMPKVERQKSRKIKVKID